MPRSTPALPLWRRPAFGFSTTLALALCLLLLAGCAAPKPDRRGAAPHCGGSGQPACDTVAASRVGASGCESGSFLDPRQGGECWRCPDGARRTVFPVTAGNACERPAELRRQPVADSHPATGLLRTDCRPGYFLHGLSGRCYACPTHYHRTVFGIQTADACEQREPPRFMAASFVKRVGCSAPAFADGAGGGSCWVCPAGWVRTGHAPSSARACGAPPAAVCAPGLAVVQGVCRRPGG